MNKVKFRIYDTEFNQMCQVSTLRSLEQDELKVEAHGLTKPFGYRDVKLTKENPLLQFTGFCDATGHEIYVGHQINSSGLLYTIKFEDGTFVGEYKHPEDPETIPVSELIKGFIVGNIYVV